MAHDITILKIVEAAKKYACPVILLEVPIRMKNIVDDAFAKVLDATRYQK
jgi:hypothetical protein